VPLPDPDCPLPAPSSSSTATATCGSVAGAKPVYQSVYGSFLPFCAVPDLPPTSTPSILAPLATPLATLATISWVIVAATSALMARPYTVGSKACSTERSGAVTLSTRFGIITSPPLAIAADTIRSAERRVGKDGKNDSAQ